MDYRASYPMTVNYLYDSLDRVKEVTYPAQYGLSGSPRKIVANAFDTASRLTQMTYGGAVQAGDINYNASDQTTSINIGAAGTNQVNEQYTFDPLSGLLTNQKAVRGGTTLLDLSYDYNRNNSVGILNGKTGNLTRVIDNLNNNKNREYEFDVLGRLTRMKGGPTGNLSSQTYTYDRYGNRTSVAATGVAADNSTMPADGIPNLTFDNTSNRITIAGFQYDVAGNQIRALAEDGVTWVKYEYDAANRIQVVRRDDAGQTMLQAFQYGATNARLIDYDPSAGVNRFYAAVGGTVLSEYTEYQSLVFTWTKSYTYLGDSQLATVTPNGGVENVEYNHPDRLGTKLVTNQQLGTSYMQSHLPFGKALNAESTVTNNNKRFTSYDRSAPTGLDYAVNRTYDSKQGRFTQVDPAGMGSVSLASPQTLNLYAYCANDPVNRTDPSGLGFFSFLKNLFRWIANLFRSQVAKKIAVKFVVSFVLSGGNFGVAIRSVLPDILRQLGLNPNPLLTPGWNPNLRHPFPAGVGSLSRYIIVNYEDAIEEIPGIVEVITQCPKNLGIETPWCPSPWWAKGTWGKINSALGGFADGLLFDLPSTIDEWRGINRGSDYDSTAYRVGWWTGTAASLIIPGAGAGKAAQGGKLGTKLFARGAKGLLNRNDYIRIGWSFERNLSIVPPASGREVFRIATGSKRGKAIFNRHIRLWPR